MSKIVLGELGKYLPKSLLEKTNFDEFISQEIVDDINAKLKEKNSNYVDCYREWDFAEFTTEKGNYFKTEPLVNMGWSNLIYNTLMTYIQYSFKGKQYVIRGFEDEYRTYINIRDGVNWNSLSYDKFQYDGKTTVKLERAGDIFTISDVPLNTVGPNC